MSTLSAKAEFTLKGHNPDVLTCIASLSNDEVFTPPVLANRVLDTLELAWAETNDGKSIWADPTVTFIDPFTKSGVFLREIVERLNRGLVDEIPDLSERVDHILTKQVFGIGITALTSLIARRSVYCSKDATGEHSVAQSFDRDWGNIWFERTEHTWAADRCAYCGAPRSEYARSKDLETHAYPFIHATDIKAQFKQMFGAEVQFDVVIGNPPYQLEDGGAGASAMPIYQKFVDAAKALEPRFLTMVIPSRWFAGGRGLAAFRSEMLSDDRVRVIADFLDSRDVFPGVDVAGGVCYFLWNRESRGECLVSSHRKGGTSEVVRPLLEPGADVFIRHNEGISILKKIVAIESGAATASLALPEGHRFADQVSGQKPFGLRTFFRGSKVKSNIDDVLVLQSGGRSWAKRSELTEATHLIDRWKVFTSKSSSEHAGQADKDGRRRVLSLTGILEPGSVVTETYVLLGDFDSEAEARNCLSYVTTRFFRVLIVLRASGQDISRAAYAFIPTQDFSKPWTDEELYAKYGLNDEEVAFIESIVRPMSLNV
ncbi:MULTISPECIES: Eco57I restriction-modification methylase domain-containing protein [Cryobacterium]|uniref:site-specific DNA-methyltransferase (adenine-specific) n=1 Tax=Cryobacterium glucosi TaxID=1259175 RepID=A0ABY2ITB7_9MICO|nr:MULTISPECIES: Eco57I restriction-modification methylase domain-containing protein [Cryobacterium]TFB99719.1 restriction endonuclease [Cryobacterium sp. MDB2-A-1]TFC09702.1 restriction endonuclease [Cryobacterium sp. MDB2-A-2]TFC22672.1 restriction endonuclease [Cryobacterium glucosi]TFC23966.1 restriction endonuclease [Cryobacterium sp. MDB2-10]